MAFAVPKEQAVGERQLEMAQDISSRLALALETRQLFERTEAQALRERKASETASLLISATDVRAVLNLAAESFNQALGAVRTHIYVHPGLLADLSSPDGSART
jgi:GAF domain-containing protein